MKKKSIPFGELFPQILVGLFLAIIVVFVSVPGVRAASVFYVKPSLSGSGDCSTWADACTLQTALTQAAPDDEIWVAAGVHYPGTARDDSFNLKNGVAVYGGFDGTETLLAERDWLTNLTVLSGDIDQNDTKDANGIVTEIGGQTGENAYHVVTGIGASETAVLDGFVINAGRANGTTSYHSQGGGVYLSQGNPTLNNLVISANYSNAQGGGVYNDRSTAALTNVAFRGNYVYGSWNLGGGMYNANGSPLLTNVLFSGNNAYYGGGLGSGGGSPQLVNVTMSGNASADGGGVYISSGAVTLVNSILWGNSSQIGGNAATVSYSIVQGGYAGTGNLDIDPLFAAAQPYGLAPTSLGNYRLTQYSPAVDVASNTPVTAARDLDGNPRLVDGDHNDSVVVDMGAYEWQATLNLYLPMIIRNGS